MPPFCLLPKHIVIHIGKYRKIWGDACPGCESVCRMLLLRAESVLMTASVSPYPRLQSIPPPPGAAVPGMRVVVSLCPSEGVYHFLEFNS